MMESHLRCLICEVGRRMWQRGLIAANEGNISVRLDGDRILATPRGVSKGHLSPDDLVMVLPDGNSVGQPSTEIKMHLRIYERRPDCMAVVHAHPPVATGFALEGRSIPDDLLPESTAVLGRVPLVPYATPGTNEVPDAMEPFLADCNTFLLAHHGAVTLGEDLMQAHFRMETLEQVASIVMNANLLGGAKPFQVIPSS